MRTLLLAIGLGILLLGYSQAQHRNMSAIPTLTPDQWRAKRIAVADQVPLRIHGGRLFDLTEVATHYRDRSSGPLTFYVYGRVISNAKGGLLLRAPGDQVVFLRGLPGASKITDNTVVGAPAFLCDEPFQYQAAATGATRTVPAYDWGQPFAGSGKKFDVVTRVARDATTVTVVKFEP